jgi:hypothetical protein
MTTTTFIIVLIGVGTVTSWLFKAIDLIEKPARRHE